MNELIQLFRPDLDQKLSKLDFVKSIDAIYKSLRQLSMNIEDSGQIDKALSFLVNLVFYFILGCFVLEQLGVDPFALFVSLSSLILGFAFIFGGSRCVFDIVSAVRLEFLLISFIFSYTVQSTLR